MISEALGLRRRGIGLRIIGLVNPPIVMAPDNEQKKGPRYTYNSRVVVPP